MIHGLRFGGTWPLTWARTRDPMINSHLLYQLSYRGLRSGDCIHPLTGGQSDVLTLESVGKECNDGRVTVYVQAD